MLLSDSLRVEFFEGVPRYRYLETLGRGGMGIVYKAEDRDLDEVIAIKVLFAPPDYDQRELLQRFKREISLNRKIKHPNVARAHDYGISGVHPYITMEFVPGRDLSGVLRRDGALGAARAVSILRQIALGTAAGHEVGIVHRDLKPQNVMVLESGAIAILDYGLARGEHKTGITLLGVAIGTPHYMAPEQACGEPTDARADIYSIGVIAFEILTGHFLFDSEVPLRVARKHVEEPVPVAELTKRDVPPALIDIVLRCLAKRPDERFQTAAELASRLALVGGTVVIPADLDFTPSETKFTREEEPGRNGPPTQPGERRPKKRYRPEDRHPVVMVVDDDPALRRLVSAMLTDTGCEVTEAGSGNEALEVLQRRPADLVLMDILLPGMHGLDATRAIKSQKRWEDLPVILMSAFVERDKLAQAIQAGGTDFMPKPFDRQTLLNKVWSILEYLEYRPTKPF